MSHGSARLTLEDFAVATGLPLAALEHPLSQPPLQREPLPCPHCETREQNHAAELEAANTLNAETVQSLQQSLQTEIASIRTSMHNQQAKALSAVLSALLPGLGDAVLRQRLSAEIQEALTRDDAVTLHVPKGLDVSAINGVSDCTVKTDAALDAGQVIIQQAASRTEINCGPIVQACLRHFNRNSA